MVFNQSFSLVRHPRACPEDLLSQLFYSLFAFVSYNRLSESETNHCLNFPLDPRVKPEDDD